MQLGTTLTLGFLLRVLEHLGSLAALICSRGILTLGRECITIFQVFPATNLMESEKWIRVKIKIYDIGNDRMEYEIS